MKVGYNDASGNPIKRRNGIRLDPCHILVFSVKVIRSRAMGEWLNVLRMESFPFTALSVCSGGKHGIDLGRLRCSLDNIIPPCTGEDETKTSI